MNSLNHYAYGAVAKWFYEGILGINSAVAGFRQIDINPQFNQRLNQASGSYNTPHGEVSVAWTINQGQLDMQVTLPKNSRGNFVLGQIKHGSLMINGEKVDVEQGLLNQEPDDYQITGTVIY
ncbi:alpha-L-rhamnosidase C-terminal domain-containing protein [Paraglaciecola aquimarina]